MDGSTCCVHTVVDGHNVTEPLTESWLALAPLSGPLAVCPGLPPASLLTYGVWPESCNFSTPIGRKCFAACQNAGNANIICANGGQWEVDSLSGECQAPAPGMSTLTN